MMKRLTYSLLMAGAMVSTQTSAQERPNIILFLVDDMGVMDTSVPFLTDAEGQVQTHPLNGWYHTPNMERLANQGIRYEATFLRRVLSADYDELIMENEPTIASQLEISDLAYETIIQRNIRLGEAPSHGKPVMLYDATATGAVNYLTLAKEFLKRNRKSKQAQKQ